MAKLGLTGLPKRGIKTLGMKMTEQERDNTLWNVIEVETTYNVPQSAKLVLSAVKYTDLPGKVVEYRASLSSTDLHYGKGEVEDFTNRLRDRWNQAFEWEQGKDDLDGYWMGSTAFDHWHTNIPRKPPTCDLSVCHYLFFQRVEGLTGLPKRGIKTNPRMF